jgi:hypothetical protein
LDPSESGSTTLVCNYFLKKFSLKNGPHSDQFRSDIIRVWTYFAFGERDSRTKIVRTKVSFGRVSFGDRPFGDRSFGDRAFGDLTVYLMNL